MFVVDALMLRVFKVELNPWDLTAGNFFRQLLCYWHYGAPLVLPLLLLQLEHADTNVYSSLNFLILTNRKCFLRFHSSKCFWLMWFACFFCICTVYVVVHWHPHPLHFWPTTKYNMLAGGSPLSDFGFPGFTLDSDSTWNQNFLLVFRWRQKHWLRTCTKGWGRLWCLAPPP